MVGRAGRVGVNGWMVERVGGGGALGVDWRSQRVSAAGENVMTAFFSDSKCASKPPCAFVGGTAGRDQ